MKLVGLIFAFIGLYCLAVGISMGMEGMRAMRWPTARGRIIQAKVEELRTPSKIRIARLCLNLDYLYMVGDKILEGHRLNSGWRCFASEDFVKKILERYPVGKKVEVYYNPARPEVSLLEPGLSWSVFFFSGLGLVTLSITYPFVRSMVSRRGRFCSYPP